jgi:hypothetical protein
MVTKKGKINEFVQRRDEETRGITDTEPVRQQLLCSSITENDERPNCSKEMAKCNPRLM